MSIASAAGMVGIQRAGDRRVNVQQNVIQPRGRRGGVAQQAQAPAEKPAYYDPQQEKLIGETETRTRVKQAQLDELTTDQKAELLELTHAQQMREAQFANEIQPLLEEGRLDELRAKQQQQKIESLRTVGAAAEVSPEYAQFLLNHNARSLTGKKDTNVKVEVQDGKMSFYEEKPVVYTDPATGTITQRMERQPYQGIRNVDLGKLKTMGAGVKEWQSAGSGKIYHPTTGEVKGGEDTVEVQLPSGAKVPVNRKTGQPLVNLSPLGDVTPGPGITQSAPQAAPLASGAPNAPKAGVGTGVASAVAPAPSQPLTGAPSSGSVFETDDRSKLTELPPGTPFILHEGGVAKPGKVPEGWSPRGLGVASPITGNAAVARQILQGR